MRGIVKPIYHFDHNVLVGDHMEITAEAISIPIPGQDQAASFNYERYGVLSIGGG